MKNILKSSLYIFLIAASITSCGDMSKKVEVKYNELNNKVNQLDSLVNKEVGKVMALDSLINIEGDKIKKLDSLVNKSTFKIDSVTKTKIESLRNIIN